MTSSPRMSLPGHTAERSWAEGGATVGERGCGITITVTDFPQCLCPSPQHLGPLLIHSDACSVSVCVQLKWLELDRQCG